MGILSKMEIKQFNLIIKKLKNHSDVEHCTEFYWFTFIETTFFFISIDFLTSFKLNMNYEVYKL